MMPVLTLRLPIIAGSSFTASGRPGLVPEDGVGVGDGAGDGDGVGDGVNVGTAVFGTVATLVDGCFGCWSCCLGAANSENELKRRIETSANGTI